MDLDSAAKASLDQAKRVDPSLKSVLDHSAGYAVFPKAGKGGFIVGGAYGQGVVFENGKITGYCNITEGSVGLIAGGQEFSQILVFRTPQALNDFRRGDFTLKADASAVALKDGAAGKTIFRDDVAVFIYSESGLMADASVGGETFHYTPMEALKEEAKPAGTQMEGSDKTKY
jgi:lipid-binding SYLF domain-containing protein